MPTRPDAGRRIRPRLGAVFQSAIARLNPVGGQPFFSDYFSMHIKQAVPLLRVSDVERSIAWYYGGLGFTADPFPAKPPYQFAILRHGQVELMLRLGARPLRSEPQPYDWDVYLRLEGSGFRELYDKFTKHGQATRRMERMFYGLAEFEITDPDGYVICLSQQLENMGDLPPPAV